MAANPAEFEQLSRSARRELLAHCYRMTGSLGDAEDALQDAFVRASRSLDRFEGRSSLKTWLYRIATNACLDLIGDRRGRSLPELVGPPDLAPDTPVDDPRWLEPYPDALIGDHAPGPEARLSARESVRLAFIVAIQALPARQRAALILRDVVEMSAEETAATLDMTVPAVNSALQRARATLEHLPRVDAAPDPGVLERYVRAWESGDATQLVAVLRSDAVLAMPPTPTWVRGAEAIAQFVAQLAAGGPFRLAPCAANAAPAFAVYQRRPGGEVLLAVSVLAIAGGQVSTIHSFVGADPARYAA